MKMYMGYIKERENKECIEFPSLGFITYKFFGSECYIADIYVVPQARRSSAARRMADKVADIARDRGCTILTGSVCPTANGSKTSMEVLRRYGMEVARAEHDIIYFSKRLK